MIVGPDSKRQQGRGDTLAASVWHDAADVGESGTSPDSSGDPSGGSFSVFLKSRRLKDAEGTLAGLEFSDLEARVVERTLSGENSIDAIIGDAGTPAIEVIDAVRSLERLGYVRVEGDSIAPTEALRKLTDA